MSCNKDRFSRCAPPPDLPPDRCGAAFLMQKILASGQLHRRCFLDSPDLCGLPEGAQPPFTVTDVFLCGDPAWREDGCMDRYGLRLEVTLPLCIRLSDACRCFFTVTDLITERLVMHPCQSAQDCWRGQIYLQAAVRMACPPRRLQEKCAGIPLEVLLNGYLLCACPTRPVDPCRDHRPLFPPAPCGHICR